jgi:hypothetical protein
MLPNLGEKILGPVCLRANHLSQLASKLAHLEEPSEDEYTCVGHPLNPGRGVSTSTTQAHQSDVG